LKNDLVCQLNFGHKIWDAVSVMTEGVYRFISLKRMNRMQRVRYDLPYGKEGRDDIEAANFRVPDLRQGVGDQDLADGQK
jgi:hypothetical protein